MPRCSGLLPLTIFKFALFLLIIIINNFVFLIFAKSFICSTSLTRRTFFHNETVQLLCGYDVVEGKGGRCILILPFISR